MMAEYIILDEFLSEEAKESADAQGYLHELVRCKDCRYNPWSTQHEITTFWKPCMEIKPEDHWYCWCSKAKDS